MKLKELAKQLGIKPIDLIKLAEAQIAPGCDALTELTDEQVAAVRADLEEPETESATASLTAEIDQQLAATIVGGQRQRMAQQQADYLIEMYETQALLPAGTDGQIDQRRAALVIAASAKKPQPQWGGEVMTLAAEVEVIDGQVVLPDLPVPQIELVPAPSDLLPASQPSSVAVAALPSSSD